MAFLGSFTKDPASVLTYSVDWDKSSSTASGGTGWLGTGETVSSSTFAIAKYGGSETTSTLVTTASGATTTVTTVTLSGGAASNSYLVTNQVVTSDSNRVERSFVIKCKQR